MNENEPITLQISYSKEDFHKICRFCLTETEKASLMNLFRVMYEGIFIKDILTTLFGDKITSNKTLPQNLCHKCLGEIIRCYNFKKTYDTSCMVLQAIVSSSAEEELCFDEVKTLADIEQHPDDIKLELPEETEWCEISSIKQEFKDDSIEATIEDVVAGTFTPQDLLLDHKLYTKSHKTQSDSADPTIEEIISREVVDNKSTDKAVDDSRFLEAKVYRCVCEEIFYLESEFIEHKTDQKHKSSRKNYCCEACNKFFDRSGYAEHLRTHTKERPFICEKCSERFTNLPNLKRHIRVKHNGEKAHVCDVCNKRFTALFSLKVHKRSHTGETPYLCHICGKGFAQKGNFDQHKRRHSEKNKRIKEQLNQRTRIKTRLNRAIPSIGKRVSCKECYKVFTATSIYTHMLTHGKKTIPCDSCEKSFYTKGALKSHSIVHTGVKEFTCEICSRSFAHASSLKSHVQMHSGIKPYSCQFCFKRFRQSAHLHVHVRRVHTGERPYVCEYCNKGFPDSGALVVHVRIHTGERPYKCDVCSKGFHHSSTMKKHRKIHLKRNVEKRAASVQE